MTLASHVPRACGSPLAIIGESAVKDVSVLIVEDEGIVALDLSGQLADMGCTIVGIASSGARAIEMTAQLRPDLVLMDVRLKGDVDGIQAAKTISDRFGTQIVFLTALVDPETMERTTAVKDCGYLTKPFTKSGLQAAIEAVLT
jgi:CheY-like chemotaxis protein